MSAKYSKQVVAIGETRVLAGRALSLFEEGESVGPREPVLLSHTGLFGLEPGSIAEDCVLVVARYDVPLANSPAFANYWLTPEWDVTDDVSAGAWVSGEGRWDEIVREGVPPEPESEDELEPEPWGVIVDDGEVGGVFTGFYTRAEAEEFQASERAKIRLVQRHTTWREVSS